VLADDLYLHVVGVDADAGELRADVFAGRVKRDFPGLEPRGIGDSNARLTSSPSTCWTLPALDGVELVADPDVWRGLVGAP